MGGLRAGVGDEWANAVQDSAGDMKNHGAMRLHDGDRTSNKRTPPQDACYNIPYQWVTCLGRYIKVWVINEVAL
jgi:hypothetical protein